MKLANLSDETMLEITILLDKDDIIYDIISEEDESQTIYVGEDQASKMSPATIDHLKSLGFLV